ncbi:hypothetical protein IKF43_02290 [Candidatus Saccharibacteria bacterium]|nr:hypothetical protein [Candidatus Saccharibacteria bacterium]
MNNEFASFEKMPASTPDQPADKISAEQIEEIAVVGEQHDDTPRATYQERGAKAEAAAGNQPATESPEAPVAVQASETAPEELSAEEVQQSVLDEVLQAHEPIHSESQFTATENQNSLKDKIRETINKAKNTRGFKIVVAGLLVASIGLSLAACGGAHNASNNQEPTTAFEQTAVSGEQANGVSYDYRHYLDYENKDSKNAYDYSLVDRYGDRDATIDGIMDVAERNPEALASYAYQILNEEEKQELGIDGMNMTQIDDAMSNDENGGKLQKDILTELEEVLKDENSTRFDYYLENNFEETSYVYFIDDNNDGTATPEEMHIGYSTTKRDGAPQVNILRKANTADGKTVWVLAADINLKCGGQVNYSKGEFPEGVPKIDQDSPDPETTTKPTPETTTETTTQWGKSGDPHAGEDVTKSPPVDPNSQKSKEENDNTNKGNQGNSNTKPGSSSNNTDSNKKPSNPDRKSGGENQGGSSTNGNNSAPKGDESREQSGNESQRQAQEQNQTGGDNNTNSEEEQRVADGDF